jgi:hypothetical protein
MVVYGGWNVIFILVLLIHLYKVYIIGLTSAKWYLLFINFSR